MRAWWDRVALAAAGVLAVGGCSPPEADYGRAVKAVWPEVQADARGSAEFLANHASSFEQSSRRSAEISRSLGGDFTVSASHRRSAADARAEANEARYLSRSNLVAVRDVRCASAEPLPGENCEMILTLKGPDTKRYDTTGSWRFDRVGGKIQVVGAVQR